MSKSAKAVIFLYKRLSNPKYAKGIAFTVKTTVKFLKIFLLYEKSTVKTKIPTYLKYAFLEKNSRVLQ